MAAAPGAVNRLEPPYTEATNIDDGVPCYICQKAGFTSWGKLMQHVKRHGVKQSDLAGTHFYTMANQDFASAARDRYQQQREQFYWEYDHEEGEEPEGQEGAGHWQEDFGDFEDDGFVGEDWEEEGGYLEEEEEELVEEEEEEIVDPSIQTREDGTHWKLFLVKVGLDGKPTDPLVLEAPSAEPIQAKHKPPSHWTSTVPNITIKQVYLDLGEIQPSEAGGRAASWPIPLGDFRIDISGFNEHLKDKRHSDAQVGDMQRGINRFFHMLEIENLDLSANPDAAANPAILVGVLSSEVYKKIFRLPMMQGFPWSRKMLDALKVFVEWQKTQVNDKTLFDDDNKWEKMARAFDSLSIRLKANVQKQINEDKHERDMNKRVADAEKLEDFPSVQTFKETVLRAMRTLFDIKQKYSDVAELPHDVQCVANACIVLIIWFNGFGGRKKEWEIMKRAHCYEQIKKGLDFFICSKHKTSHLYGNLAKWVATGTMKAIEIYLSLPCKAGTETFLVPTAEGQDYVCIPTALKRGCRLFLPPGCTWPTVNLMRKWYHTELHKLTQTEAHLLNLMKTIDAHSPNVAKKHYILQTPKDDAKLAKALVHAMLGEPVPWPENNKFKEISNPKPLHKMLSIADKVPEGHDEEDTPEDEFGFWDLAKLFGISEPLPVLGNAAGSSSSTDRPVLADQNPAPTIANPNNDIKKEGIVKREAPDEAPMEEGAPKKRGRKSPFSQDQIAWILEQCRPWGLVPPPSAIHDWIDEDKKSTAKMLPDYEDKEKLVQSIRHVLRQHYK